MSTPLEAKIDYFRGVVNVVPFLTCTLMEFLGDIQQGIYKRQIEPLRRLLATGHHEGYKKAKTALDAITPCGSFYPTRGKDHLLIHSGIVHGDLDHLDDLQAAKHLVCSDPHTVYCFDSPGGAGLKIGVHVEPVADDPAYKHAWQTVATYYQKYNVAWDESGKDISRLCFVSFDPDCYINPVAMPPGGFSTTRKLTRRWPPRWNAIPRTCPRPSKILWTVWRKACTNQSRWRLSTWSGVPGAGPTGTPGLRLPRPHPTRRRVCPSPARILNFPGQITRMPSPWSASMAPICATASSGKPGWCGSSPTGKKIPVARSCGWPRPPSKSWRGRSNTSTRTPK